jgi:hypothetical protein
MILTESEVAMAIYADEDYDKEELRRLARLATSYIKNKTGYDFSKDHRREPLAVECAIMYVRQSKMQSKEYNRDFDFAVGINSLLKDLQVIADAKISKAAHD